MTKHLSDDKPTSQSDPFPPPQLSLVTVETARRAESQIDDTHSSAQGRSVDWYIYIMYVCGSYTADSLPPVLKLNMTWLCGGPTSEDDDDDHHGRAHKDY